MAGQTKKARRGQGEGSIAYREDKQLWTAQISLGFDGKGKRIRKTVYGSTKGEVAEQLRKLQNEHAAGQITNAEDMTTKEYLERWLLTAKNRTHGATFQRYEQLTKQYLIPSLGAIKLTKLRPIHVEGIYANLTRDEDGNKIAAGTNTRKATGVVLGIALRHAVRLKLINSNPAADVRKPRAVAREMLFMTPGQARHFLTIAKTSNAYALHATAVGTGMRQGELLGLSWADVDFDKGTIDVRRSLSQVKQTFILKEPKSATSRRTVTLPLFVLTALQEHRAAAMKRGLITGPVFSTKAGTYLQRSNVLRCFRLTVAKANKATKSEAEKTGIHLDPIPEDIRFHDLRHTHASGLIAAGHSIKAVSRRLGHSDVSMTLKVYAHLMPDDDAKLASGAGALFA